MKKAISYVLIMILFVGCQNIDMRLTPNDYIKYLEDPGNGFNRTIVSGEQEYVIQLATPEYMTVREFSKQLKNLDTAVFNARLKELNGHIFFLMKLKNAEAVSVAEELVKKSDAERMVMYYHSAAAEDIKLITDSFTQRPVTYLFENNYSLVPHNTIVVGFEWPARVRNAELLFNDKYNGNPYIKTQFSQSELAKLPGLAIK